MDVMSSNDKKKFKYNYHVLLVIIKKSRLIT